MKRGSAVSRLLWFVGIWACSVAAIAVIGYGLRWIIRGG